MPGRIIGGVCFAAVGIFSVRAALQTEIRIIERQIDKEVEALVDLSNRAIGSGDGDVSFGSVPIPNKTPVSFGSVPIPKHQSPSFGFTPIPHTTASAPGSVDLVPRVTTAYPESSVPHCGIHLDNPRPAAGQSVSGEVVAPAGSHVQVSIPKMGVKGTLAVGPDGAAAFTFPLGNSSGGLIMQAEATGAGGSARCGAAMVVG